MKNSNEVLGNSFDFYFSLAKKYLISIPRKNGSNMCRHQASTFFILREYTYNNLILLKASLIHDLFEEISDEEIVVAKRAILTIPL